MLHVLGIHIQAMIILHFYHTKHKMMSMVTYYMKCYLFHTKCSEIPGYMYWIRTGYMEWYCSFYDSISYMQWYNDYM